MAHTMLGMVTAAVFVAVFVGLAIHVTTSSPGQPISWIFSLLSLSVAWIYLSSFFLATPLAISFELLRWKWAVIIFSPTLYLHLISSYFHPVWQRYRFWLLSPIYLINTTLALMILFTSLVVADFHTHPPPHIIGPISGPFMPFAAGFFLLEMAGGFVGLAISARASRIFSLRRQILAMLTPTGLILLASLIHWLTVLTETEQHPVPHELPDALLAVAAILYARIIVRYGSFVGRPLAQRSLFYLILATITGLAAFYLSIFLDQRLMAFTAFPYPLVTGLLIVAMTGAYPTCKRWVTRKLDRRFFRTELEQRDVAYHLVNALAKAPTPEKLQAELLELLCTIFEVDKGYVALSRPELPPDKLAVQTVQGNLPLKPGTQIDRPPLPGPGPCLAATLLPQFPLKPSRQEIALFCPFFLEGTQGILALGEKRDKTVYSSDEVTLCIELAHQLKLVERWAPLRQQQADYVNITQLQDQALRQLEEAVISSPQPRLTAGEGPKAPLEISILGPLQVARKGQLIPESAWGSEKAKALLAYLLWKSPLGVSREELSQTLWPERAIDETANVFHVTLHRLRRALRFGEEDDKMNSYIQCERGRYRFNIDLPHWLDVDAFQELTTCSDPVSWKAAVKLYRGAYLEDLAWAFPPEVEAERRQLEQLYGDTLRRLAVQSPDREAGLYLEKLLAVEPGDEAIHRALLLNYLARGRHDLAQHQITRWQQALADLDLEPLPDTMELWQIAGKSRTPPTLSLDLVSDPKKLCGFG